MTTSCSFWMVDLEVLTKSTMKVSLSRTSMHIMRLLDNLSRMHQENLGKRCMTITLSPLSRIEWRTRWAKWKITCNLRSHIPLQVTQTESPNNSLLLLGPHLQIQLSKLLRMKDRVSHRLQWIPYWTWFKQMIINRKRNQNCSVLSVRLRVCAVM